MGVCLSRMRASMRPLVARLDGHSGTLAGLPVAGGGQATGAPPFAHPPRASVRSVRSGRRVWMSQHGACISLPFRWMLWYRMPRFDPAFPYHDAIVRCRSLLAAQSRAALASQRTPFAMVADRDVRAAWHGLCAHRTCVAEF